MLLFLCRIAPYNDTRQSLVTNHDGCRKVGIHFYAGTEFCPLSGRSRRCRAVSSVRLRALPRGSFSPFFTSGWSVPVWASRPFGKVLFFRFWGLCQPL